jgi:hypothetical protein
MYYENRATCCVLATTAVMSAGLPALQYIYWLLYYYQRRIPAEKILLVP